MKRQNGVAPRAPMVRVSELTDADDVVAFTPKAFLKNPKRVEVTVPASKGRADDSIELTLVEGDWEHSLVWIGGEVKGGIPNAPLDGVHFNGGCVRIDQLQRFIEALQLLATEADKLGLRSPRPIPKVKST